MAARQRPEGEACLAPTPAELQLGEGPAPIPLPHGRGSDEQYPGTDSDNPAAIRRKCITLAIGAIAASLWAWAWLDPASRGIALDRLVLLMAATAAMTVLYAAGLVKLLPAQLDWAAAGQRLSAPMACLTALLVLIVLAVEAATAGPDGAALSALGFAAVGLALLAMAAGAIVCAIVPGRDPLGLSERGRMAYVYAAEGLLVLFLLHLRLCHPELFRLGIWSRYWPLITLGLAFAGVGLGEVFRHQGRRVLAEPLHNTAALLPILPAIGFFMLTSQWDHARFINYSTVLFLAGLIYGSLAFVRRSFGHGLLAALAGNGALWHLLHHAPNLAFLQHPQLWLIPASLSVLAAAALNRDRLSVQTHSAIRYTCLIAIYVSSTADIWINGLRQAPHLALVLAVLSAAGALCGILLRIQSFLFLGTVFLLVSITTMIRYAQLRVGANWPWLVAGLLLGIAIVVVFALFEKKRKEMLALVEQVRDWRP